MRRLPYLALALVAGACRSQAVYAITVDASSLETVGSQTVGGTLEVEPGGTVLARSVEVTKPRKRETNGVVELQFDLRNRSVREKRFDYRFEWADASGMAVDSPPAHWIPVVLGGHERIPVASNAPNPQAVRCTLKVRLSR